MAAISSGGGKREANHDLPLVPMIDFMLCLVAFLLVTAVWSQQARLDIEGGEGQASCTSCTAEKPKRLHVEVQPRSFRLSWKQGETVVASSSVARQGSAAATGDTRYPELASKISEEWRNNGSHRSRDDVRTDQAVLHTENATEYGEIIAVVDAIAATKRALSIGGRSLEVPAFSVRFAAD
jgi:biopolymer transport protein ExbD